VGKGARTDGYYAPRVRVRRIILVVCAVILFVVISGLLARVLSVPNAEQAAITDLIIAEAHGDTRAVIAAIRGCAASPSCRAGVANDVARLRRAGPVQVVNFNASAGFSLGSTTGVARVAWIAGGSLPIVQCVEVRRAGNVLTGQTVQLLELSAKISGGADCPTKL
jgi:hypothetical protein